MDKSTSEWIIPIHGWIFEREEDSAWRKAALSGLAKALGLEDDAVTNRYFQERARMFLVDNERWKSPEIQIGGNRFITERSATNGHFKGQIHLGQDEIADQIGDGLLSFSAVTEIDDKREFSSQVQLLPSEGVSVISDIDDTIKESMVLDKRALLANTFLRPYQSVEGMAGIYSDWEKGGAAFHYVSSSPWQLYPFLAQFMGQKGFPRGAFHLKQFRAKDRSLFKMFASSEETKPPIIRSIFETWPEHRFILVGDSGEKDPEIYGQIAREFPDRVRHIFIRRVEGADNTAERFDASFSGLSTSRWSLFSDPQRIRSIPLETAE
ncbi:MAG: App1 family protein [Candidatus Thiodiazotropha sp. (ex Notomyrtea botanica)]|nr:App1 family protein [Candidatus Thiodiazotropha sp. (ex Notomyrtea botanica)]